MAQAYVQQLSKVIVAQITQTIGWNSIQTTPLELLTDILHRYLEELTRQTQRYTELYGRTEPNLNDVALAFNDMNINLSDIEEYIANVDPVPCIVNVPKFPLAKESNLNFLKPGSKEVLTRPVHIPEHLPPIFPLQESPARDPDDYDNDNDYDDEQSSDLMQTYMSTNQISDRLMGENGDHLLRGEFDEVMVGETAVVDGSGHKVERSDDERTFKKPAQPPHHGRPHKDRKSTNKNDKNQNVISRPTREIVSCFMTTSGFISPAREGKLPEAKKPIVIASDEPPAEVVAKMESPSPEPAVVAEPPKRQKRDRHEMEPDVPPSARRDIDRPFDNEDNDNEVKLYEVIQTEPLEKSPAKKKPKRTLLAADQPPKETKKQKKLKQLNLAKNKKSSANNLNFHLNDSPSGRPGAFSGLHGATNAEPPPLTEKQRKKLQKMESLKKKHRKERQMGNPTFPLNDVPAGPDKRKKKLSKLSKKNLAAMGLNPNSIEGFAISAPAAGALFDPMVRPGDAAVKAEPSSSQHNKDGQKKNKQMDKQKIKFFKKLQSTSSSMLSRPSDDVDRSITPEPVADWSADRAPTNVDDYNWSAVSISEEPSPGKKSKQQKKSKAPKELKPAKVKKPKEGKSPAKKPRTPKLARIPEEPPLPVTPKLEKSPQPPSPTPMSTSTPLPKPHPTFIPGMDLLNRFPGPGLIPSNPLFQPFPFDMSSLNQVPHYPFAGLPGFDFANMARFKRPTFGESSSDMTAGGADKAPEVSAFPSKPLCNVASLMPPSLASEMGTIGSPFGAKSAATSYAPPDKPATVTFENRDSSPIVIDSEEDFSRHNSMSQSPTHQLSDALDSAGHADEVKRKKNKDKSSKEAKKDKRDKELGVVKLKKKKDKKDKVKSKQRHGEHSKSPRDKDKAQLKKEKREKKREKERAAMALESREGSQASVSEWSRDAFGRDGADNSSMDFNADNSSLEANAIPKLTLKFSSSPSSRTSRPSTPDFPASQLKSSKKKKKKHWRPLDDEEGKNASDIDELPPAKHRPSDITEPIKPEHELDASTPLSRDTFDGRAPDEYPFAETTSTPSTSRGRPKNASNSHKSSKSKASKQSTSIGNDLETFDSQPSVLDVQTNVLHTVDEKTNEESKVWICPACGKVDDGSPMIGCDGCDAWYHWPCVGIHVAPEEDQDWFCRNCMSRKQDDKKKKRKKKDKKEH